MCEKQSTRHVKQHHVPPATNKMASRSFLTFLGSKERAWKFFWFFLQVMIVCHMGRIQVHYASSRAPRLPAFASRD